MRSAACNFLCAVRSCDFMLESLWPPWLYTHRASTSESSSAGVQKAPGRALAGLWPKADPVLRERTHYTPLPLKYNFSRKVKVFFEV